MNFVPSPSPAPVMTRSLPATATRAPSKERRTLRPSVESVLKRTTRTSSAVAGEDFLG